MVLFIFFLLALPIFLSFLLKNHRNNSLPPGPPGLPFIGNLHQLDNKTLPRYLWKLSQKYGPLMSLRLGSVPVLVISSPKMAQQVLETHDHLFCNRTSFVGQQKISYNCSDIVFAPYDTYWREMKKLCKTNLFSANRLLSHRPIREFEVSYMLENISKLASASKPVNLTDTVMTLTSTIICRVGFGKRYEEGGIEWSRYHHLITDAQDLLTSFYFSDYFPLFGFVDKLRGLNHRLEKVFREWDLFYEQLIQEHLDPTRPKPQQEDILDVLLRISKDTSFKIQLSFDNIKAVLMNVFLAGTDPAAATVIWAMTLLMKNPKAMKKAQEEVRGVIGNKGSVNEDDIQQLPYLKAVVKETMRSQTAIPLLVPRKLIQSCNLEGYEIPANTVVYVNSWALGRDPEVWENPEEFCPERFIGSSIDVKGKDFGLLPFGSGRRICPGMIMGLTIVELCVANLLYSFDWEMPSGMKREDLDMDMAPGVTMFKKNPLCLVPTKHV